MRPPKRAAAMKVSTSACEAAIVNLNAMKDHAPSVTVFTNIAGAVAVTVDRDGSACAGRQLSSMPLPENAFNPFRERRSRRREPPPTAKGHGTGDDDVATTEAAAATPHVTSAAAAAVAVEGIKKGVQAALDRWALQT